MVEEARGAGALHAAWSGAGPSAVALATEATERAVARALGETLGEHGEVLRLEIERNGLVIT
jgi:shikimate kinase